MNEPEQVETRASADPREAGPPRLVTDAPALVDPGWLPPESTGWAELDELAILHRRLLARRAEVGDERRTLVQGFEGEDAARHEAQTAAFLADDPGPVPDVTSTGDRKAALDALTERARSADAALDEFLSGAVSVIEAHVAEWTADLVTHRADAAGKRREAARLLEEARAEEIRVARVEQWVMRNGGVHERASFRNIPAMRFVTWHSQEAFTPPAEPEEDGHGGLRLEVVDVPSSPPWDAERNARRQAAEQEAHADERAEYPERFVPDHIDWNALAGS